MAAVVAATALKGRGARNARVLRGKERDPREGRVLKDSVSFISHPARQQEVRMPIAAHSSLQDLRESGGEKDALEVTQSNPCV